MKLKKMIALLTAMLLVVLSFASCAKKSPDGETEPDSSSASESETEQKKDQSVTIEFAAEHSESVAKALQGGYDVVLLPEPFVTQLCKKDSSFSVCTNLTREWENIGNCTLAMGCIAVNADFYENNKEAVAEFVKDYAESAAYVNANITDAASLIESHDIMAASVAESAIPNANIVCYSAEQMKSTLTGCYSVLMQQNPQIIGGSMPGDDFYIDTDAVTPAKADKAINISVLKGPTGMGAAYMWTKSDKGETANTYNFTLDTDAATVGPKLMTGEYDIASIPTNLAASLYNKSNGKIKVIAVNTLGVLYLVSKDNAVTCLDDLNGKTILASGKGTIAEYALNYVLESNGFKINAAN